MIESSNVESRFRLTSSGRFYERFGPLGPGAAHSNKKLCLVATDRELLADVLYGLSRREDCYYVKYAAIERDGMHLGRCFLQTDEATAELCEALKGHPRLMVSVQDDAWFNEFRTDLDEDLPWGVWDDWPEHEAEVARVLEAAFARSDEAQLVARLRAAGCPLISLVAQVRPEPATGPWPIVGHVLLTPVTIDGKSEPRGLGLAPLAVVPEQQRKGFGKRLVSTAQRRARMLGYEYLVVLGDPAYYKRFGFAPAANFGLGYPAPVPEGAFRALELREGALSEVRGVVRYHSAFG